MPLKPSDAPLLTLKWSSSPLLSRRLPRLGVPPARVHLDDVLFRPADSMLRCGKARQLRSRYWDV